MITRCFLICIAVATICLVSTDAAVAQRGSLRVNQGFRHLGGGWSHGYHWRTPAYKVGYYNPYSRHNSRLKIGGLPQGAGSYIGRFDSGFSFGHSTEVSSFDQVGGFDGSATFVPGPVFDPQVAPSTTPRNIVTSEIDDITPPPVQYRNGPENGEQRNSILSRPKPSQPAPVSQQSSPSDRQPTANDGARRAPFDELEGLENFFSGGGR